MNLGTPVPTFWCEPTGRVRRYYRVIGQMIEGAGHYCDAMLPKDEVADTPEDRGAEDPKLFPWEAFPTCCDQCGQPLVKPERQIFAEQVYVVKTGPRAGEEFGSRSKPVGAMFDAPYLREFMAGADGICLHVRLPDGDWCPDARASNCTLPDDKVHRCWCRHADPRTGYVHVDKDGVTCQAGGGSIWQNMPDGFHGFVHRGYVCTDRAEVDRMLDAGNPVAPAERSTPAVVSDLRRLRQQTPRTAAEMRAKLRASARAR